MVMMNEKKETEKHFGDCERAVTRTTPLFMAASEVFSILVFLTGCAVLLGWALDIPELKSALPGLVTMKANTALCFVFLGFSLWALQIKRRDDPFLQRLAQILSGAVLTIGLLTLLEYIFQKDLGIDQLLFKELPGALFTSSPGRMAFNTAIDFIILGLAFSLLASKTKERCLFVQILMIPTAIISLLSFTGFFYHADPLLIGLRFSTAMALHTIVLFLLIFFGVLFCRPGCGIMNLVSSDTLGGKLIRRLCPVTILIPLILGWIKLHSEYAGIMTNEFGVSFVATGNLVVTTSCVIFLAFWLDRTDDERTRIEKALEYGDRIIATLREPFLVLDKNLRVISTNQSFYNTFKVAKKDTLGRTLPELGDGQWNIPRLLVLLKEILPEKGIVENYEIEHTFEQIGLRCMNLNASQLRIPKKIAALIAASAKEEEEEEEEEELILLAIEDITECKRAEEKIKKTNSELSTMAKELEAFSYSVSHDLKAPLRAMAGFANILSEDYAPKLDENGRRVIGVINDNAKKMGQLIDDLLKLSHLGRMAMEVVDIDMKALVESICRELKEDLSRDRSIEVLVKPLPPARADAMLIKQVFTNLISNAIKFTVRKGKAVIEIGGYDKNGERVYYVKDNGAGFDMKYADKLFGIFQRIHAQEEFGGTGIGLAIVKSAVLRHGGRVWAEGKVGQGATFYFTLP